MTNVGRCPRCHKFLVAEEKATHLCRVQCNGAKSIFFDCIDDPIQNDDGDTVRIGVGLDGYYYRLVVCKHNPPHSAKRRFTDPNDQTGTLQCFQDRAVTLSSVT
jgi:hypothetical protein